MSIRIAGLKTLPEIQPRTDLGGLIREAAEREGQTIGPTTVVVVAQKIVSKAEGALVDLNTVEPGEFASRWAAEWGRDARLIELVLRQSKRIVRMDHGILIAETLHGFVAANAGVDVSNSGQDGVAIVLPADPDGSACLLREELGCGVLLITDTFGRAWRDGLVNVAIGVSGMQALDDLRGGRDRAGHVLLATVIATADELASAAGLVMPKAGGIPVALIEGASWVASEGSARTLIRPAALDLFR